MSRRPQDSTEANVSKALKYQQELEANMGGTEILSVLKAVYDSRMVGSVDQWRREIIFLTDGDVVNHAEVCLNNNFSNHFNSV